MKMLVAWWKHLREQFAEPAGWKLIVPPLTFLAGIATIVLAFMSYQSSDLDREMEAANRSYSQLMGDASSDSVRTRIGAIHRIPPMLYRLVPEHSHIGPWEATRLAVGLHARESAKYHEDMKFVILGLFAEVRSGNSTDPSREVQALINLLIELGPQGWYGATPAQSHAVREQGLQWLWKPPTQSSPTDPLTVTLFNGLPLERIDLSGFALVSADLRGSLMFQTKLSRSHLTGADLTDTCATDSDFDFARLEQVNLSKAYMSNGHFESSSLRGALLDKADLSGAHFENADLSESRATGAHFVGTKFMHSQMVHATLESDDFDAADFTGADLSNSDLDFSRFEHGVLRGADLGGTSLRRADLFGADLGAANFVRVDLRDADLRDSNLFGARNLFKTASLAGANIAGVRGLSKANLSQLLAAGAILTRQPTHPPLSIPVRSCQTPFQIPQRLDHVYGQTSRTAGTGEKRTSP